MRPTRLLWYGEITPMIVLSEKKCNQEKANLWYHRELTVPKSWINELETLFSLWQRNFKTEKSFFKELTFSKKNLCIFKTSWLSLSTWKWLWLYAPLWIYFPTTSLRISISLHPVIHFSNFIVSNFHCMISYSLSLMYLPVLVPSVLSCKVWK